MDLGDIRDLLEGRELPEGLESFLKMMEGLRKKINCNSCPDSIKTNIGSLSGSEHEEFNSILAEGDRMEKIIKALIKDKGILKSRRDFFWKKLEKRLGADGHLTIDGDTVFSVTCNKKDCL